LEGQTGGSSFIAMCRVSGDLKMEESWRYEIRFSSGFVFFPIFT
jgi:hypothetical protein